MLEHSKKKIQCRVSQEVRLPNSIHHSKERPSLKLSISLLREANMSKLPGKNHINTQ